MNKKISIGLCICLIILTVSATFSGTMLISKQIYNKIISDISQRSQVYDTIDEVNRLVSNYYYGTVPDKNVLNSSIAAGYINGLEEGENFYLSPEDYTAYIKKLESETEGIGVEVIYSFLNNQLIISHVFDSSPAKSAGLAQGDIITAIDDVAVNQSNYEELSKKLSAGLLTEVKIEYERDSVTSVCEPIGGFSIPSVVAVNVSNMGYIRIDGFYKNTASELKACINRLTEQGLDKFIFDLRNTSDGNIEYCAKAIDVIVPASSGSIAVARSKNGEVYKNNTYSAESSCVNGTFAVLVNEGTSGPGELFAADMRDMKMASLVGIKTAGVGTMQELFTLNNGGAVLLTVAAIEPYSGSNGSYNKTGLTPDLEIALQGIEQSEIAIINITKDNQISAAVGLLAE